MRKNNDLTVGTITGEHPVTDPIFWGQRFSSVVVLLEGWKYAGWAHNIQLLSQSAFLPEKTEVVHSRASPYSTSASANSGLIRPCFVDFLLFFFFVVCLFWLHLAFFFSGRELKSFRLHSGNRIFVRSQGFAFGFSLKIIVIGAFIIMGEKKMVVCLAIIALPAVPAFTHCFNDESLSRTGSLPTSFLFLVINCDMALASI